jgi:hypothetical protein
MSILDELAEHFDARTSSKEQYGRALAELNAFCEQELNHEQAERLNDIAGDLINAAAVVNSRAGMKLGARIIAGLLTDDS